jgi:hypothetical protein
VWRGSAIRPAQVRAVANGIPRLIPLRQSTIVHECCILKKKRVNNMILSFIIVCGLAQILLELGDAGMETGFQICAT